MLNPGGRRGRGLLGRGTGQWACARALRTWTFYLCAEVREASMTPVWSLEREAQEREEGLQSCERGKRESGYAA